MKNNLEEVFLDGEEVFSGKLLHVYRDRVRLPNQNTTTREYIRHPGAALIVPVLANGELLLERQYRYPLHTDIIEFPAGKLDAGEEPLTTAQRELHEETGYRAEHWRELGQLTPLPAYSDETIYCFCAEELTLEKAQRDEDEFLELITMTPDALRQAITDGRVTDAKTICAFFWWYSKK